MCDMCSQSDAPYTPNTAMVPAAPDTSIRVERPTLHEFNADASVKTVCLKSDGSVISFASMGRSMSAIPVLTDITCGLEQPPELDAGQSHSCENREEGKLYTGDLLDAPVSSEASTMVCTSSSTPSPSHEPAIIASHSTFNAGALPAAAITLPSEPSESCYSVVPSTHGCSSLVLGASAMSCKGPGTQNLVCDLTLEAWCAAMDLGETILARLQEERFKRPEHLLHMGKDDLAGIVEGLRLGEKANFYDAVNKLSQAHVGGSA